MIADDEAAFRYLLKRHLEPHYQVVASVVDGAAAIIAVEEHSPDILLVDISMPVMNGLEAAERITKRCPSVRIIFVSGHTEPEFIEGALGCGAVGYVHKDSFADLSDAICSVMSGQVYRPEPANARTLGA